MRRILNFVVLASLITATVGLGVTACNTGNGTGATGGTVTITVSNGAEGHYIYGYVYAEDEIDLNNPAKVLATNYAQITGGAASFVLKEDDGNWNPTLTEWTGNGGFCYDIYIYTDSDGNGDIEDGTVYVTDPFAGIVTIDGNQTVSMIFTDMVPYTPGPS